MEKYIFQGRPVVYCGLQPRLFLPPFWLVNEYHTPEPTTVSYNYAIHKICQVDAEKMLDDLLLHPVARDIVAQIIDAYGGGHYEIIGDIFKRYDIPIPEWQNWVYILKINGFLYPGVQSGVEAVQCA
jgi:hypothetical protein